MTTVLYVHGGEIFATHDEYISYLQEKTPQLENYVSWNAEYLEKNCEDLTLIKPRFPCKENAKYDEWKIIFDKYVQAIDDRIILLGFSLGGIFLAKWLAENKNEKIAAAFLVAAPYFKDESKEFYRGWELQNLERLGTDFPVTFFASTTDEIVPLYHAEKYQEQAPHAKHVLLTKTNHFFDAEFPELIERLQEAKDL